jgi:hypothetical protein
MVVLDNLLHKIKAKWNIRKVTTQHQTKLVEEKLQTIGENIADACCVGQYPHCMFAPHTCACCKVERRQ